MIDNLRMESNAVELLADRLAGHIIDYGELSKHRPLTVSELEDLTILNVEWQEAHRVSKSYSDARLVMALVRLNSFRTFPKGV